MPSNNVHRCVAQVVSLRKTNDKVVQLRFTSAGNVLNKTNKNFTVRGVDSTGDVDVAFSFNNKSGYLSRVKIGLAAAIDYNPTVAGYNPANHYEKDVTVYPDKPHNPGATVTMTFGPLGNFLRVA